MLTIALFLLFALLCAALSVDRTWDSETMSERNQLVFAGRNHDYGAFVLRREYDRRFLLAFVGAIALFGALVAVPKVLGSMGVWSVAAPPPVPCIPDERVMEWFTTPENKPNDPRPPAPRTTTASPTTSDNDNVTVVPKDSMPPDVPKDTPRVDPEPVTGNPGPIGPAGAGPVGPGTNGAGGENGDGPAFSLDNPGNPGIVDHQPEFPGGQEALARFIQNNLVVRDEGISSARTQVIFVVDTDGSVVQVRTRGKAAQRFNEAAERVIWIMPRWKPARYKDRAVPCVMVLPIEYRTGW